MVKPIAVGVWADAASAAQAIAERLRAHTPACVANRDERMAVVEQERAAWESELDDISLKADSPMAPRRALRELERAMPANAMVSTDIGNICSVANSYLRFEQPNSFLAAMSFGNCGYAFPTAIGAKVAAPDRPADSAASCAESDRT